MQIIPYSESNLAEALSNTYTSPEIIRSKFHFTYFTDYLGTAGLDARQIVIEEEYVSKDFLQDYSSYYAFCFEKYPKFCRRIHFFDTDISDEQLKAAILLAEDSNKEFWSHYLGFIVVKPIPSTVIGFTVLKTYPGANKYNDRHFWGTREYKVHIFGHEHPIKSLAFQEQDSVLAACATTAIWSMLNKASTDFHTILKSPSQITKDADHVSPDGSRLFPNKGLSVLQICQAIFNSGLVSEVKQPDYEVKDKDGKTIAKYVSNIYAKKILTAYSSIGIPVILVISVPNGERYGLHAVTVSGFWQSSPTPIPPKSSISLLSENIEKIYAHDDQWGPFVRMQFNSPIELETLWTKFHAMKYPSYITNIIVPVYPKIRISYEDIEAIVRGLDTILTLFFKTYILHDLVWEIKVHLSEAFKSSIKTSAMDEDTKFALLTKSLPKYLWITTCFIGPHKVFEFTFDATDVNNGMIGEDIICYLPDKEKITLLDFLKNNKPIFQTLFSHRASANYYQFLIDRLK